MSKKLSKQRLEVTLQEIESILKGAIDEAKAAAHEYAPDDIAARRSFECGFLGSRINRAISVINLSRVGSNE